MAINHLRNKEICFVNENFDNVSEKEDYLYAVFEGDAASLERALESYLLISSTSFVHSQTHDKSWGFPGHVHGRIHRCMFRTK